MRSALLVAVQTARVVLTSCNEPERVPDGPSPDDVKARLGGLDEQLVVGVAQAPDHFLITGRCLKANGAGFEVKVDLTSTSVSEQISAEDVAERAKHPIRMACYDRQFQRLNRELELLAR